MCVLASAIVSFDPCAHDLTLLEVGELGFIGAVRGRRRMGRSRGRPDSRNFVAAAGAAPAHLLVRRTTALAAFCWVVWFNWLTAKLIWPTPLDCSVEAAVISCTKSEVLRMLGTISASNLPAF